MPTPAQITRMQEVTERYMPDTVTIYRPPANPARKPSGAPIDTYPTSWQTVASGVKCRVVESRLSGIERLGAGVVQATGFYNVSFPYDTEIDETCRFKITASLHNPQLVGVNFDVKAAPLTSYAVQRIIQASKTAT